MTRDSVQYLFIDGGCLRATPERTLSQYIPDVNCRFDLTSLSSRFSKIFLYDAVSVREPNEPESTYLARIRVQQDMLDAAAQVHGVHVYEGTAHRRQKRLEQKKVDVMIAVDMLTHTFRRNMGRATLLTGDGDFQPLIDALVHDGMFVTIWYPRGHASNDLLRAADSRRPITTLELHELLEPRVRALLILPEAVSSPPSSTPDLNSLFAIGNRMGNC